MPRFQQFERSESVWPAGLVFNPPGGGGTPGSTGTGGLSGTGGSTLGGSCVLPQNPRAGQSGVNDPYFASDADRTAWIASHPTCTPPPPFLPDSAPTTGAIKFTLSAASGSLPADLAVSVDGNPVAPSGPPSATGEVVYSASGLSAGSHNLKITGTGIQFTSLVNAVAGATIGMPIQLAVTPGTTPGTTTQPPAVPATTPPATTVVVSTPATPWGAILVTAIIAGGVGWAISRSAGKPHATTETL